MSNLRRLSNNALALLAIIAVLSIVFSVLVGGLTYYQQSQDRIEVQDYVEHEVETIGTYILEAILRNDYQNILSFIENWGAHHSNIARVSVRAPNGFEIANYHRPEPPRTSATKRYGILHKGNELATVELVYDIKNLLDERHSARLDLLPYIAGFAAILALILWVALQRLVLAPMQLANKAKTDFMSNMSHELRTPLNAVIGFSETMKDSVFGPLGSKQYEEYAGYIHSSGTHLLQLINDILDVSAVEAGKLELREGETSIVDACEAAISIINPKAQESRIALNGISKQDLPLLMGDPLRLKQIFINLISNAVKFTPEHGSVSCDAFVGDDGDMVIKITDTGVGMDEEGMKKAMDMFGQVDSSLSRTHEGTGLGLPLTKGLVELHNGTMEITSEKGIGTTVNIRFPKERVVSVSGSPITS